MVSMISWWEVTWIETTMVQNSPHLCLWYINNPGNSACTWTWASLHCFQNITFTMPSLFTFSICSWEGMNLPQSSVQILKCFAIWNLWSGCCCWYYTTAALPFPLQKPYTEGMLEYSSFVRVLGILTAATLQHNSHSSLDSVREGTPLSYSSSDSLH
jgi:hypothetical protein